MSQPTVRTLTLGCKVNQYETELVREALFSIGYRDALSQEPADVCVVNTCTVTGEGDSKSRQAIRRFARENPDTRLMVMGCYATRAPEEINAISGVTDVITDKRELPDWLQRFGVVDVPTGISSFGERHRAYVKVQDGCMLRCSYCIIPYVRPNVSSRPIEHIEDEVARLVANGYREIVLTGIHLGHYGVEGNWNKPREKWTRLSTLARRLASLPGDFRLRLSSIEATEVTRELIEVMVEFPEKIAPHLHICLQSGSDPVLRRMKRRWSARLFLDRCEFVRKALNQPAITTDIIVGFPGESEADFQETLRASREAGFSKIHIFPFSARKGTPAASMNDVVDPQLKNERVDRLRELEAELREDYFRGLIGKSLKVLAESPHEEIPGAIAGTSCRYAPVVVAGGNAQLGDLLEAVPTEFRNGRLIGA